MENLLLGGLPPIGLCIIPLKESVFGKITIGDETWDLG